MNHDSPTLFGLLLYGACWLPILAIGVAPVYLGAWEWMIVSWPLAMWIVIRLDRCGLWAWLRRQLAL